LVIPLDGKKGLIFSFDYPNFSDRLATYSVRSFRKMLLQMQIAKNAMAMAKQMTAIAFSKHPDFMGRKCL
jgi:hypothetical protein